jgi:hypothetical protein
MQVRIKGGILLHKNEGAPLVKPYKKTRKVVKKSKE